MNIFRRGTFFRRGTNPSAGELTLLPGNYLIAGLGGAGSSLKRGGNVLEIDILEIDVPEIDVPEKVVPEIGVPEIDVPEIDVPEIDVPG